MKIRIKRYYQVVMVDKELYFGISKKLVHKIMDKEMIRLVSSMVPFLKGMHDVDGIIRELENQYPVNEIEKAIESLFQKGILETISHEDYVDFPAGELSIHSRNMLFYEMVDTIGKTPIEYQRMLKNSTVTIWGLHGVGAQILLMLSQTGVGHIRGIDRGKVDRFHLNSKILYQYEDIGKPKGLVLSGRLKELNPFVDFHYIDYSEAQADNMKAIHDTISQSDCVVFCLDLVSGIGIIIDEFCVPDRIPYIMVGKRERMGIVGPFCIPGQSACYLCNEKLSEYQWEYQASNFSKKLQFFKKEIVFSPIDTLLGNYAVTDIVKYLSHLGKVSLLNKQFLYDIDGNILTTKSIYRQVDCPNCREQNNLHYDEFLNIDEHLSVFAHSLYELVDFFVVPIEKKTPGKYYEVIVEGKNVTLLVNEIQLKFLNLLKNAYSIRQVLEFLAADYNDLEGEIISFLSLLFCAQFIKAVDGYQVTGTTKIDYSKIHIIFNSYTGDKEGIYYRISLEEHDEQLLLPEPSWNAVELLTKGMDLEDVRKSIMKQFNTDTLNMNPLFEILMDKGFIKYITLLEEPHYESS
jgi:molybdopterin/thiamine biosynthesis adenylyltransferase